MRLLQLLLHSDNYGERRGAAFGLAGLVKGSGILVLKQLDIMTTLTNAVQNKKNAIEREGIVGFNTVLRLYFMMQKQIARSSLLSK